MRMSLLCRRGLISAVLLLSARPGECAPAASPGATVKRFYSAYIPSRQGGLPEGKELERLAPFLSRRLHGLIVAALSYREAWIKRHPDEPVKDGGPPIIYKPPFVDGDHFSSVFEGPKRFKVRRSVPDGAGAWRVHIHFWYEAGTEGWEDVVLVRKEHNRYVIDDVLLTGAGPFNPAGRLSEVLQVRDED
jgi:hypothetical protein